jgi:MFS family permease
MSGLQDGLLGTGAAPALGSDEAWRQQVAAIAAEQAKATTTTPPAAEAAVPGCESETGARHTRDNLSALPPRCFSARAVICFAVAYGIFAQTALRSVPSFILTEGGGMQEDLQYSNTQKGAILSAFGWAYTVMQIPGGYLSQICGAKWTLFWLPTMGFIAAALMPVVASAAQISFVGPLVINAIIGASQGATFPVSNGIFAMWLSVDELGRGNALLGASWHVGQVFQFLVTPLLINISVSERFPGIRYTVCLRRISQGHARV